MSLPQLLQSSRVITQTKRGDRRDQSNLATASPIPPYIHMTSECYCQNGELYKETTKSGGQK